MFSKTHKGKFKPKQPKKYDGDAKNIVYRSSWERGLMNWCDKTGAVESWNSEEEVVPYFDPVSQKIRRYFIDMKICFKGGKTILVEVKPAGQTRPPKKPKRQTKRYIKETTTYVTNQSKWKAAREYAKARGYEFQVWTEDELKKIGAIRW